MPSSLPLPACTVVITNYNYSRFIYDAIRSVQSQTLNNFQCLIVDDGSTDNSIDVIRDAIKHDARFTLLPTSNHGVAHARNYGIARAKAPIFVPLDADDMLGDERFLETLVTALEADPALGIAFTGLRFMAEDGTLGRISDWPSGYNYEEQLAGHNQVPCCCAVRVEAWQRVGGYRSKYTPAEDAALWLAIGALGYKAAQVTTEGWFHYRLHSASLSSAVRTGAKKEPDWRGDKPWIASGQRPFAADGKPRHSWPVRNYDKPKVSVIIPVGTYHRDVVREAIDSIEAQTEQYWECIVVNDSGAPLDLMGMPFVRVVDTSGGVGAAVARNMGIRAASAPMVTFLDADDVFDPRFLERTLRFYAIHGKYIYTDWMSLTKDSLLERHDTPEFNLMDVFRRTSIHSINILIPKADLLSVGLFDESMTTWEDTDLFMKLAASGICGVRLPEALITYRYQSGQLRERGEAIKPDLLKLLGERYAPYITGEIKPMCCGSTNKNKPASIDATVTAASGGSGMVRIVYNGPVATHDVIGTATKKRYGRREQGDVFFVYIEDHEMTPDTFVPMGGLETIEETPVPPEPVLIDKVTA